jgi:hypothetical protein
LWRRGRAGHAQDEPAGVLLPDDKAGIQDVCSAQCARERPVPAGWKAMAMDMNGLLWLDVLTIP